jgi:uncharacterized protein (TIGR02996 family)
MTDREAMLRAVAADPDEDTPRLVYADLLDELGGAANAARARFIRLQIDLVRNPGRNWFANSDRLCEVARMAGQFADAWLGELPKWAATEARRQRLRADDFPRGFLDEFRVKPLKFVQYGGGLLDAAPITRVVVTPADKTTQLTTLLTSSHLLRVRSLALPGANGDTVAAAVRSNWGALAAVEELDLSNTGLTDDGAISLTNSRTLKNLRVLIAHRNHLSERGAARLLGAGNLPRLEKLDVRGTHEGYRWGHVVQARYPGKTLLV